MSGVFREPACYAVAQEGRDCRADTGHRANEAADGGAPEGCRQEFSQLAKRKAVGGAILRDLQHVCGGLADGALFDLDQCLGYGESADDQCDELEAAGQFVDVEGEPHFALDRVETDGGEQDPRRAGDQAFDKALPETRPMMVSAKMPSAKNS